LKAGPRSSDATQARAFHFVDDELHPKLARLVLHDEQQFVGIARQGLLRAQQRIEAQIVAVAHRRGEIFVGCVGRVAGHVLRRAIK
jgi:hypothetical protein